CFPNHCSRIFPTDRQKSTIRRKGYCMGTSCSLQFSALFSSTCVPKPNRFVDACGNQNIDIGHKSYPNDGPIVPHQPPAFLSGSDFREANCVTLLHALFEHLFWKQETTS